MVGCHRQVTHLFLSASKNGSWSRSNRENGCWVAKFVAQDLFFILLVLSCHPIKWCLRLHYRVPTDNQVGNKWEISSCYVQRWYNAESPTPVYVYRKHSWQWAIESSKANEGCIQYTSWGVPVALFLTTFARTARFLHCQNQSVQLRLICIYVCPTSAHRGFRYGYRRYKDNTFTLKTTLFCL